MNDSEADRFLQSIPKGLRAGFSGRVFSGISFLLVTVLIAFPGLFAVPFANLLGLLFGFQFGMKVLFAIAWVVFWSFVFARLFFLYRDWILRRYLKARMINGALMICLACGENQKENSSTHCSCGCLVRIHDKLCRSL